MGRLGQGPGEGDEGPVGLALLRLLPPEAPGQMGLMGLPLLPQVEEEKRRKKEEAARKKQGQEVTAQEPSVWGSGSLWAEVDTLTPGPALPPWGSARSPLRLHPPAVPSRSPHTPPHSAPSAGRPGGPGHAPC